jgi:hypothetical protein
VYVTRGILERREEQFVSREVLTKRRYVLNMKWQGFLGHKGWDFRGQDDRSWTMKYARLHRSKVRIRVQRWVLKYIEMRKRSTSWNTIESYE